MIKASGQVRILNSRLLGFYGVLGFYVLVGTAAICRLVRAALNIGLVRIRFAWLVEQEHVFFG